MTGATGRTGSIVVHKLQQRPKEFIVQGFARSEAKVRELFGTTDGFYLGDIGNSDALKAALEGCDALVILTSALPQMKAPPQPGQQPEFIYPEGGTPEQVDYRSQVNQIDAARAAGVKHIV